MRTHINTKPDETMAGEFKLRFWNPEKRAELPDYFGCPELPLLEWPGGVKKWELKQMIARKQRVGIAITDLDTCKIVAEFHDQDGVRQPVPEEELAVKQLEDFVRAVVHEYGNDGYLEQQNTALALTS